MDALVMIRTRNSIVIPAYYNFPQPRHHLRHFARNKQNIVVDAEPVEKKIN